MNCWNVRMTQGLGMGYWLWHSVSDAGKSLVSKQTPRFQAVLTRVRISMLLLYTCDVWSLIAVRKTTCPAPRSASMCSWILDVLHWKCHGCFSWDPIRWTCESASPGPCKWSGNDCTLKTWFLGALWSEVVSSLNLECPRCKIGLWMSKNPPWMKLNNLSRPRWRPDWKVTGEGAPGL